MRFVGKFVHPRNVSLVIVVALLLSNVACLSADEWFKKADMPTARALFDAAALDGKIYAVGGMGNNFGLLYETMEEYDPFSDEWTKKSDMPRTRVGHSLAVVYGKIFVIGGHSQQDTLPVIDVYDPQNDKWLEEIEVPNPRSCFASVVTDDKFI